MSTPATAPFLDAWRQNQRRPVLLAKVEIIAPSAKTLYLATEETWANSLHWQSAIVGGGTIRAASRMLSPGPELVTSDLELAAGRYLPELAATAAGSLSAYRWQGAIVTLWRWEKSLSAWADALQVFKGRINRPTLDGAKLTLYLMQSDLLESAIPNKTLNKTDYPNAPDAGRGLPIPFVGGEFLTVDMRHSWPTPYDYKDDFEDVGAGLGAVPGLLVDPGYGGNAVKIVYAEHAVGDLEDRTSGLTQFLVGGDQLNPLDTAATQETLTGDSYITVDDDEMIAYYGVIPNDVVTAVSSATPNTALNPRNAMDVFDETSYATLDQGAGQTRLVLRLPRPPMLGMAIDADIMVAFSGDAANTHNIQAAPYNFAVQSIGQVLSLASTATTPSAAFGSWRESGGGDTLYTKSLWDFPGVNGVIGIVVNFSGGTTNKARVYAICVRVKYRPSRAMAFPAQTKTVATSAVDVRGRRVPVTNPGSFPLETEIIDVRPAIYEVSGQFYGHIKGAKDDGSGTYTGVASATIQRAPDLARYLLVTYAGVAGADIEIGASAFGSFVRARDHLNGGAGQYNLACHVGQVTKIKRILQEIARQSASTIYLDRFDNKWKWITWGTEEADTYDYEIDKESLLARPRLDQLSDVAVRQRFLLQWFHDFFRGRSMFEAAVLPDRSSRGFNQADFRDQRAFTVTAGSNDKLDWSYNAVNYTDTLAAATYADAMAMASQVRTQMRVRNANQHVGWGFSIRTGYNDKLDVLVTAVEYTGTLAAGDYAGPEALCDAVEVALNASGSGLTYTCAYDYNNFKFAVTGSATFTSRAVGGTNTLTSGWFALGFSEDLAGAPTATAQKQRYAERFWADDGASTLLFGLRFESGANVATGCHKLLGYELRDYPAGLDHVAPLRRNNREAALSTSESAWGEREPYSVACDYIRAETVAVVFRDRLADLLRDPPMLAELTSHRFPDLQRGRVLTFNADVNDLTPYAGYGSNGSWAGKRLRVVEVVSHNVTAWHDEAIAVET